MKISRWPTTAGSLLARALVNRPNCLLDEPLSGTGTLTYAGRCRLNSRPLQREVGLAFVFGTA